MGIPLTPPQDEGRLLWDGPKKRPLLAAGPDPPLTFH